MNRIRAFFWRKVSNNQPILVVRCDDNETLGVKATLWQISTFYYQIYLDSRGFFCNCLQPWQSVAKESLYLPAVFTKPSTPHILPTVRCSACVVQRPKQFSWAKMMRHLHWQHHGTSQWAATATPVKEVSGEARSSSGASGHCGLSKRKVPTWNSNNQPAAATTTNCSIQTAVLHIPAIVIIHLVLVDHSDSRMSPDDCHFGVRLLIFSENSRLDIADNSNKLYTSAYWTMYCGEAIAYEWSFTWYITVRW